MSDLKGKDIKRQTLTELVEYVTNSRNVISEPVYPEVLKMVTVLLHALNLSLTFFFSFRQIFFEHLHPKSIQLAMHSILKKTNLF